MTAPLRDAWTLDPGVTYLNHGSFGPSPDVVRRVREQFSEELERQPMDFLVRRLEPYLDSAAESLGAFVGADAGNLAFVPNATCAMNAIAASIPLAAGDEVIVTDQEYGAVVRIWGRACSRAGAKTVLASLPSPPESADQIVDAILGRVSERTRLIIVSHVTSQTATVFPVEAICAAARDAGVPVCVDGPHAIAMRPLEIDRIGCDFYCASCHKWLCGPFGSGFLYIAPKQKSLIAPALVSWGKSLSGRPGRWQDEFQWFGTYDPAPYLALPAAIRFLEEFGLEQFRETTHRLVRHAALRLVDECGAESLVPDRREWYGSMATLRLPRVAASNAWPGKPHPLQVALWEQHQIEVPILQWKDQVHVRVSCHLYNDEQDIERLVSAIRALI